MKKVHLHYLFIISFSIFFINCTPKVINRVLVHQSDVSYWDNGQGVGQKTVNDVTIDVVYSHTDKDYIFFDVAYINHSEEAYLVDAHQISIFDHDRGGLMKGIDPELIILGQEMKRSRREANSKTVALVAGAAVIAGTAVAIANADGGSGSSSTTEDCDIDYYDGIYIVNNDQSFGPDLIHNYRIGPLLSIPASSYPSSQIPEFWQTYSLRKTTLFKGERVRGLVGFLKDDKRNNISLNFNINGTETSVEFQIDRHQP